VIAGLLRPEHGRVVIDGTTLLDTAAGIFVPAYRRHIGYVFQEGRLFPHLSVRRNLLYGRLFTPRAQRRESFTHVVDLLDLGHLLGRAVDALSGGETQLVAIGRALLASPRLLLMDEPLSSLDERRKSEVMPFLERLRDEARVPIVYVSHIFPEIARLAETVVLMADGKVVGVERTGKVMLDA
jgi:molybdate transport system ATP-binding protein